MKARVNATGEIVEVKQRCLTNLNGFISIRYVDQKTGISYFEGDLDFDIEGKFAENCLNGIKQGIDYNSDYWTRLEHQYAGMAMQGYIIAQHIGQFSFCENDMKDCVSMAHALVEKLKSENNGK